MPSKSKKQAKTMTAACKNPKFRKKVGIAKKVACDFHKKDKGKYHESHKKRKGYVANPSKKQLARIQTAFGRGVGNQEEVAGWITPDLEVHEVGEPGEHYTWLLDHFNLKKNSNMEEVYRMGFIHGYVRYRSTVGYLDVEGKKENVFKTEEVWRQFAKNRKLYIQYVDSPMEMSVLESQLNESEYLGRDGESGGWITADKKVHPVEPYSHFTWVTANYGDDDDGEPPSYSSAFEDGAVRYILGTNGLELNGFASAIKSLFNVWWPTAARRDSVLIDPAVEGGGGKYDQYHMPEHKQHLLSKWRPGHPTRDMVKKMGISEKILKELRQYINLENEYGGWITKDKKVHIVDEYGHIKWVERIYLKPEYFIAFNDGAIRYQLNQNRHELNIHGFVEDIAKLFFIWWPTAIEMVSVNFDLHESGAVSYKMPEQKDEMRAMFRKPRNNEIVNEMEQLNELREYLGQTEDEYGGWISKDKKVHVVQYRGHHKWAREQYGDSAPGYRNSFALGNVRYHLETGTLNMEGKQEDLENTFYIWWPTAVALGNLYVDYVDEENSRMSRSDYFSMSNTERKIAARELFKPKRKPVAEAQLNELREYIGLGEYGGWITPDKKVHTVGVEEHYTWVIDNYYGGKDPEDADPYLKAFRAGAIRYVSNTEGGELSIQGSKKSIRNLFRIWWPTAINMEYVVVSSSGSTERMYEMPEQKKRLQREYGLQPKIREDGGFYQDKGKDRSLGASYTVSIYKHQVNNIDEGKWDESVQKVKEVKSGISRQSALKLQRKIIDELQSRNSHSDNGWTDYFTRIEETEGGTVGFMFRGGYYAGMKSTAKNTKKRKKWSPLGSGQMNEDMYGSDSTPGWITPKGLIHDNVDHGKWVKKNYGTYKKAFDAGCVRFRVNSNGDLNVQGTKDGLQKLFREWYPLAINSDHLFVDVVTEYETLKDFQDEMDYDLDDPSDVSTQEDFEYYYKLGPFPKQTTSNSFKFDMRTDQRKIRKMFRNRKVNEKYNTNSTWLKVGKNIVEIILNKVTRRVKRGKKITEEEIPTYKIFVDGVDVGYVDNIDKMFLVKNDKTFDKYDNIEEAISNVMGSSYYDGKGSTEFIEYNPDPYALNV